MCVRVSACMSGLVSRWFSGWVGGGGLIPSLRGRGEMLRSLPQNEMRWCGCIRCKLHSMMRHILTGAAAAAKPAAPAAAGGFGAAAAAPAFGAPAGKKTIVKMCVFGILWVCLCDGVRQRMFLCSFVGLLMCEGYMCECGWMDKLIDRCFHD